GSELPSLGLVQASSGRVLAGQVEQKSCQKEACTMWKTTETVNTEPAIQCQVTQSNCGPTFGTNAVMRSVNMDAAMTQWNRRATSECRGMRSGRRTASSGEAPSAKDLAFEK